MAVTALKVTSHVGRDLLASAAAFKTEAAVVWEYVVNSLQYLDFGVSPKVQVDVSQKDRKIEVSDNGRGMTRQGLAHFFKMHGENPDRVAGRPGRGKFGTGKSAAFGIAKRLRVDTCSNGLRNVVVLTRGMIETSSGGDIPVEWEVRDEHVALPNGTTVVIDEIQLARIQTEPIIEYIERHLQAYRAVSPQVAVNYHICEPRVPEIENECRFHPTTEQQKVLGDVELFVRVSRGPLSNTEQGIAVTAGPGNMVAIERGGIEAKEFGNYLFGEVDVIALETSNSPLVPYDPSRSLQLNPQHPVVAVLVGFIGSKLEEVRAGLVRRVREARRSEQARRLATEAERIADILNDDFRKVRQRLQEIRSVSARRGSAGANFGDGTDAGNEADSWVRGTQEPGSIIASDSGGPGRGRSGRSAPGVTPRGERNIDGSTTVDPVGGSGGNRSRPRGGFRVNYANLGEHSDRSRYDPTALTIIINLDHPVVKAALGDGNVQDPIFRRLSYEIAFSEYAMALGYEICQQDPNIPADDLLYEVRTTIHRIAASAAALYR